MTSKRRFVSGSARGSIREGPRYPVHVLEMQRKQRISKKTKRGSIHNGRSQIPEKDAPSQSPLTKATSGSMRCPVAAWRAAKKPSPFRRAPLILNVTRLDRPVIIDTNNIFRSEAGCLCDCTSAMDTPPITARIDATSEVMSKLPALFYFATTCTLFAGCVHVRSMNVVSTWPAWNAG